MKYCIHADGTSHKPIEGIVAENGDTKVVVYCPECGYEVQADTRSEAWRRWNAALQRRQIKAMKKAVKTLRKEGL